MNQVILPKKKRRTRKKKKLFQQSRLVIEEVWVAKGHLQFS